MIYTLHTYMSSSAVGYELYENYRDVIMVKLNSVNKLFNDGNDK